MHVLEPGDPRRMGEFTLVGRLGAGGMGQVFLGRSAGGRTAAVKVVKPGLADVPEFRARFRQEVAALRRVGGEGTATVLGADTEAAAPWVATEYVPGPPLHQVVESGYGPLPEATLHALAGRLARALHAIHGAGLVHRDLKPSNILLTVDGPRIIDFGIARALDTVVGDVRTSTGVVLGSPGFLSPEQVRGQQVTPAADVFSLGCVLVYAATGRLPFGTVETGPHALMFRAAEEEPDLTGVPEALTALVTACLAKDPRQRPTAEQVAARSGADPEGPWLPAELLAELGRLAARILTAETPPQEPPAEAPPHELTAVATPQGTPAPPRPTRRWRPVLAAAVALAVVATGAALVLRDSGDGKGTAAGGVPSASASTKASPGAGPAIPQEFVGAWEGVLKGSSELPKRVLRVEIAPGRQGDKAVAYIDTDGDRQCSGRGTVLSTDGDTVAVGVGQVTAGVPQGRCTPLSPQTLTVRSQDVLTWKSGALTADFYRSAAGRNAVPDQYVGVWVPANPTYREKELIRITQGPVGGRLVRLSAKAGMDDGTEQICDGTFAIGAVSPMLALSPATYTATSGKDCRDPSSVLVSVGSDGRLLLYSMAADAEPGEYVRKT